VTTPVPPSQDEHNRQIQDAYDQLAPVWSATTDDGPYNAWLERPALRSLVPPDLAGKVILDAGCGSGAQAAWLLDQGAEVIGIDLSPRMIEEAKHRCGGRGRFALADLARPLPLESLSCGPRSLDGVTSSLVLHYVRDWSVPLGSFAAALRPGGWVVLSLDHPFAGRTPNRQPKYFEITMATETWRKADVEVLQQYWRRPLAAVADEFARAGFVIERIAEARPSPEALARYPDDLAALADEPSFIVYRLRLAD